MTLKLSAQTKTRRRGHRHFIRALSQRRIIDAQLDFPRENVEIFNNATPPKADLSLSCEMLYYPWGVDRCRCAYTRAKNAGLRHYSDGSGRKQLAGVQRHGVRLRTDGQFKKQHLVCATILSFDTVVERASRESTSKTSRCRQEVTRSLCNDLFRAVMYSDQQAAATITTFNFNRGTRYEQHEEIKISSRAANSRIIFVCIRALLSSTTDKNNQHFARYCIVEHPSVQHQ